MYFYSYSWYNKNGRRFVTGKNGQYFLAAGNGNEAFLRRVGKPLPSRLVLELWGEDDT